VAVHEASIWWNEINELLEIAIWKNWIAQFVLREGEAAALRTEDLEAKDLLIAGKRVPTLNIFIVRSKTDKEKKGAVVILYANPKEPAYCPVRRWQRYQSVLTAAGVQSQFAFPKQDLTEMASGTPNGIMQRAVAAANEVARREGHPDAYRWGDPMEYGSHSLRRCVIALAEPRLLANAFEANADELRRSLLIIYRTSSLLVTQRTETEWKQERTEGGANWQKERGSHCSRRLERPRRHCISASFWLNVRIPRLSMGGSVSVWSCEVFVSAMAKWAVQLSYIIAAGEINDGQRKQAGECDGRVANTLEELDQVANRGEV
jgi:hypothetical protein